MEVRLERLLGRRVLTMNNRVAGRLEELRVERDGGSYVVTQYVLGPIGLFERLRLGIGLIVSQSIVLFNALKWLAAAYLFYIGIKALRAKPAAPGSLEVVGDGAERSPRGAFMTGFVTNGLNPKATLFFLSLFTVVINPHTPLAVQAGYGVYLSFATAIWFCLVALLFSQRRVRAGFARMGHWFDRLMGAVLVGLGVKLAFTELR